MEVKTENGTWTPKLSMMQVLDINKDYGINLLDFEKGSLSQIGNDLGMFFAILFESVKYEAEPKGISLEQFANGFTDGDQIELAHDALFAAIRPLFKSSLRKVIDKSITKIKDLEKLDCEEALKRVDDIDLDSIKKAMKEIDEKKTQEQLELENLDTSTTGD